MQMMVNGTTYTYETYGQGSPLVLLHGFTGSKATWYPLIDQWQTSFQLILIDLPGHAGTDMKEPFTMEQCCADLKELLSRLGLDTVHLLGYSMGGRTALSFAMYYPGMIRTLILESASPGLASDTERSKREASDRLLADWIEKKGVESFVDYWENIPLFQTQKQLPQDVQQNIRRERLSHTKKGLSSSLRYMGTGKQESWWHHLNQMNCPVLLLAGARDEKFININQKMCQRMNHADFQLVSQAGHAIHVEQTEIFGKIVQEFILMHTNDQ